MRAAPSARTTSVLRRRPASNFKELEGWSDAPPAATTLPRGDWWTVFGDAELDRAARAASTSRTRTCAPRMRALRQARALADQARAGFSRRWRRTPRRCAASRPSLSNAPSLATGAVNTFNANRRRELGARPVGQGAPLRRGGRRRAGRRARPSSRRRACRRAQRSRQAYFTLRVTDATRAAPARTRSPRYAEQLRADAEPLQGRRRGARRRGGGRGAAEERAGAAHRPRRRPRAVRACHRHPGRRAAVELLARADVGRAGHAPDSGRRALDAARAPARHRRRRAQRRRGERAHRRRQGGDVSDAQPDRQRCGYRAADIATCSPRRAAPGRSAPRRAAALRRRPAPARRPTRRSPPTTRTSRSTARPC